MIKIIIEENAEMEENMKIENNRYEVTFDLKGGEIASFTDKETGIQYMYQANESWGGKNPTLFPIVGNTYDSTYITKGETYTFKNHGLIRYATLELKEQQAKSITFVLKANEETKKTYPYNFLYEITYTLEDNKLTVLYDITNNDGEAMPFTFGLHPGFKTNLLPGEKYTDYKLVFENEEHMEQLVFDVNKEIPHHYEEVSFKELPLDFSMMKKYATLIYRGMCSSHVSLVGPKHSVKVSIAGYPFLAFWTPKDTDNFICIEPWYSHADFEKTDIPFEKREGMMNLEPGKSFTTSYTIEVY